MAMLNNQRVPDESQMSHVWKINGHHMGVELNCIIEVGVLLLVWPNVFWRQKSVLCCGTGAFLGEGTYVTKVGRMAEAFLHCRYQSHHSWHLKSITTCTCFYAICFHETFGLSQPRWVSFLTQSTVPWDDDLQVRWGYPIFIQADLIFRKGATTHVELLIQTKNHLSFINHIRIIFWCLRPILVCIESLIFLMVRSPWFFRGKNPWNPNLN